jgi:outer membrane cobalamin receptor
MLNGRDSVLRNTFVFAAAITLLLGSVFASPAEDAENEEFFEMSLEDLMSVDVSVASRKASTQNEAPGVVTVITGDEIRKSGARDLTDILALVPGFDVSYDTQGAFGVFVRGIWANEGKVLVLMDGLEMNDDMYGTFQFGHHIPVDIIERIEIMRGPGSVMYGESAELGVISITTISPKKESEGFISPTYSRTNKTFLRKEITAYYGMKKDDFSFSVAAHYGRGNFSDKVAENYDTAYYGNSVDLGKNKNSFVESPFINVGLKKGNFSARYIQDRYALTSAWPYAGEGAQYRMRYFSDLVEAKYDTPISDELSMTSKFTYKHQKPWSTSDHVGVGTIHHTSQKYKGENYFSYDFGQGHNIVAGVSYEDTSGRNDDGMMAMGGGKSNIHFYNAAVFAEALFKTAYGNLTLGGRQVKHNYSGSNFVPRAALTKQLGDYHVKAIYSKAYRNPHIRNIRYNQQVKAEETTIYEFELGKQMSKNWLVTANVFDMEINDPIIYTRFGDQYYTNFEKTGSRGIEISSLYKKGTSSLNLTYAYYRARENEVTEYAVPGDSKSLLGVANHKLTLLASFSPYKNMFVTPSMTYHSSKYRIDYPSGGSDYSYEKVDPTLITNLSLLFKDLFDKEGMDLSFTVHNLFDEDIEYSQPYQEDYGMIPGPSRAFTLNFRYSF